MSLALSSAGCKEVVLKAAERKGLLDPSPPTCRAAVGRDIFSIVENSFVICPLSPPTSTGSSEPPRGE